MAGHVIWTPAEIGQLKALASSRSLFRREIAEKMGKPLTAVSHMMRKLGFDYRVRERYGEWNKKHAHLREPVMRYFLTHSFEDTAKAFGLTLSETKSCITNGYKDPKLKHLRKETRRHDPWTSDELVFLLRHVGVRPRTWIAKKLKRGQGFESVKEALHRIQAGASSKYLNGMPWGWAEQIFGDDAKELTIRMKAGPQGLSGRNGKTTSTYQLIPWTDCEALLERGLTRPLKGKGKWKPGTEHERLEISEEVKSAVRAMAKFQRWIHGVQSRRGVRNRIETALKGR